MTNKNETKTTGKKYKQQKQNIKLKTLKNNKTKTKQTKPANK